jgi:hypothetical protein
VAGHVENALNALAQFAEDNPAVMQTAAVGGSVLFWVLLFVIGKKILGK